MKTTRLLISAAFIVLGATAVLMTPHKGPGGFIDHYFAWIVIALMSVAAVLEVKEFIADRRENRVDAESKSTAIQALPIGEYEDGQPATLHYPEGGESR